MPKKKSKSVRSRVCPRKGAFRKYQQGPRRKVNPEIPETVVVQEEEPPQEFMAAAGDDNVEANSPDFPSTSQHSSQPVEISGQLTDLSSNSSFVVQSLELVYSPRKLPPQDPCCRAGGKENGPSDVIEQRQPMGVLLTSRKFMEEVCRIICEKHLPSSWVCRPERTRVCIQLAPTPKATVIQRSFLVERDGQVYFSVHNKPLEPSHVIWKHIPPQNVFNEASPLQFAEHVFKVFCIFSNFVVCPGNPESKYGRFLNKAAKMVVDHNVFKERFLEPKTFRSLQCKRLIPVSWKRCQSCTSLRKQLEKRLKKANKSSPNPKTNHRFLLSPHWRKLVRKANLKIRALKVKQDRLQLRLRLRIQKEGMYVSEETNADLMSVLNNHKGNNALSKAQQIFIEEQMRFGSLRSKKGMRWHPLLVRLAIQLQSIGGSATIDAINDSGIFNLPTTRTLYDYTHFHKREVTGGPYEPVIDRLQKRMEEFVNEKEFQRYHTLLMDEMTISSNLVVSKSSGQLVGFVDLPPFQQSIDDFKNLVRQVDIGIDSDTEEENDENVDDPGARKQKKKKKKGKKQDKVSSEKMATYHNKLPQKAKKMLTFMVRGLCSDVKEVVASYGVADLSAADLFYKTWKVLDLLESNNIYVLGITCDGSPINRKFISMHHPRTKLRSKVIFDTVNPFATERVLYFFSDVPHLLKTIRNCFWKSRLHPKATRVLCKNKQVIVWDTIRKLHVDEKMNTLRLAPKLQKQVVYLNSFSLMNVKYAAVVMSRTVANALVSMKYPNISETVEFIRRVNDFFDTLNGASCLQAKHTRNQNLRAYRHHQNLEDGRFKQLMSFLNYLKRWEQEVKASGQPPAVQQRALLSPQTLHGIEMTIFSFIKATKYLFSVGAKFVLARRFCQDPLEQYFSRQRASVGGGNNPTKFQFLNTERTLHVVRGLGFKRRGNTCSEKEKLSDAVYEPLSKKKRTRRSLVYEAVLRPIDNSPSEKDVDSNSFSGDPFPPPCP